MAGDRKSQKRATHKVDPANLLAMKLQPASALQVAHNLNSQHIEVMTQCLHQSTLLDLVAIQLSQQLVKIHGQELDQKITSETILIHLKRLIEEIFARDNLWEGISKEIWSNLVSRAIQDMERDLGGLVLESLDLAGFNELLFQYLFDQKSAVVVSRINHLEAFYAQAIAAKIVRDLDLTQPLSALSQLLGLNEATEQSNAINTEFSQISQVVDQISIKWSSMSSISAQLQADLWQSDTRGTAYARYHAKHSQHNYLEHYITSSGDIEALPWEAAKQIINKLGFNAVKLQFLLAAHAVRQVHPWESTFVLKASNIIAELGWDKSHRPDLPMQRNQVASLAYALSCLVVKAVWGEGQGDYKMDTSTPVGGMWEVLIHSHGELDWRASKIEKPDEVYLTVRPGLWAAYFLDQAGSRAREALHRFGNLALNLLRLDPYNNELTLRLAIHLMLDAQVRVSDPHPYEYQVKPLLAAVLPENNMQHVQESSASSRLFDHWNHALNLLSKLGWRPEGNSPQPSIKADQTPVFYTKPYPKWLEPKSSFRKPRGWVDCWLEQRLVIKPPVLQPVQIAALSRSSWSSAANVTADLDGQSNGHRGQSYTSDEEVSD